MNSQHEDDINRETAELLQRAEEALAEKHRKELWEVKVQPVPEQQVMTIEVRTRTVIEERKIPPEELQMETRTVREQQVWPAEEFPKKPTDT